jgi:hypothetical protein
MTTILGAVCCMLIAFGGGLAERGDVIGSLACLGLGTGTMAFLFALVKLKGFSHFIDSGGAGLDMTSLYFNPVVCAARSDAPIYVQTTGSPIRAAGIYTATYAGERVVVIEAQQEGN